MKYTLRELRARKNVTQKTAAEGIGVSSQTYNAWEKDIRQIKLENLIKVANYFEVTIDQIFLGNDLINNQVAQH